MNLNSDRIRNVEEDYFRRREQELLARLKANAEEDAHRKGLAEAMGLSNEDILEVLREMGFDRATVGLLFLVPILEVAWSDGSISADEKQAIQATARAHGVTEGSPAHVRLMEWLEEKPDPVLFSRALQVVRDVLASRSATDRDAAGRRLLDACERIAAASGGFLGMGGRISRSEREVLDRLTAEIERAHSAAAKRVGEMISPEDPPGK